MDVNEDKVQTNILLCYKMIPHLNKYVLAQAIAFLQDGVSPWQPSPGGQS